MKRHIIGVNFITKNFDFFGCYFGNVALTQTDNLSKSIQSFSLSPAEEQDLETIVIDKLEGRKKWLIWTVLGRHYKEKRVFRYRRSHSLETTKTSDKFWQARILLFFFNTEKGLFRCIYFEVYDQTASGIRERFDQLNYQYYINLV